MPHIHNGAPGVAGQIDVTMINQPNTQLSPNGVFASGTLTDGTVNLASLKTLLASGSAYVNVHTSANPAGEIRGQVK
jgi:hypothetical protein